MDINQNNSQKNVFSGGMDLDTSSAMLQQDKYRIARNVHYVTDEDSNSGELRMINGVQKSASAKQRYAGKTIIGTASVKDWGIIIFKANDNSYWGVDRFKNPYENSIPTSTSTTDFKFETVISKCEESIGSGYKNKLSCVLNYEADDNIKLYIADGEHRLMMIDILNPQMGNTWMETIESVPRLVLRPADIMEVIDGQIKNPVVQYAYQLYSKYRQQSELSPLTRLLSLPQSKVNYDKDGKFVKGVAPGKSTNCGVKIQIHVGHIGSVFNKLKIYRISYAENGQLPLIELIYDGDRTAGDFNYADTGTDAIATLTLEEFNSLAGQPVIPSVIERKDGLLFAANVKEPAFTLDGFREFDARSYSFDPKNTKTHLYSYFNDQHDVYDRNRIAYVPRTHDCYNRYTNINKPMYDHNIDGVSDSMVDTGEYDRFDVDGYYGGTGPVVSWRFIETELIGDSSQTCYNPAYGNAGTLTNTISINQQKSKIDNTQLHTYYIRKDGTLIESPQSKGAGGVYSQYVYTNYSDPLTAYSFRSLRRDEVYRFGIVLYDKNGSASPAKWIADIRTPNMSWRGFETFASHGVNSNYEQTIKDGNVTLDDVGYDLGVRPLGIEFKVDCSKLPKGCTGYEIVRCNRTLSDMATVSQGVVSRPIKTIHNVGYRGVITTEGDSGQDEHGTSESNEPYTPTGFLTTARYWAGHTQDGKATGLIGENCRYGYSRQGGKSEYDYGYAPGNCKEQDNLDNSTVYQFISPELLYQRDSLKSIIEDASLKLTTEKYVFGSDGGPEVQNNSDRRFTISPCATNINLRMMGDDWKNLKQYYWFDLNKKRWYNVSEDLTINDPVWGDVWGNFTPIKKGLNQRFQIYNDYQFTPYYFYKTKICSQKDKVLYSGTSSYEYMKTIKNYCKKHVTTAKKQRGSLYNILPDTEEGGNTNISASKYWVTGANKHYATIKLYEQSNNVYCRQHMQDRPSVDFIMLKFAMSEADDAYEPNPQLCNVQNAVEVTDTAFPDDLSWDDFANSTTSDGKTTWTLSYPDKITAIGDDNYCNWVVNGAFDFPVDGGKQADNMQWKVDNDQLGNFESKAGNSADQSINGPAGRCMLLRINNKWDRSYDTFNSNDEYYRNSNTFLLTDTIGCEKALQRQRKDRSAMAQLVETAPNVTYAALISEFNGKQTQIPMYENSVLGTYICNLRKTVTPYGGSDYVYRTLNQYHSYGDYKIVSAARREQYSAVFDGDCYIMPLEYTSLHKYYCSKTVYQCVANINYSIPVETNINLALTYGDEPSRTLWSEEDNVDTSNSSYVQIEPANVANRYVQKNPEYAYNTVYSTNSTARTFSAYNEDEDKEDFTYRCRYSNKKELNEPVDSWCKFMPANYLDVDSKFGEITQLRTFRNYLYYWQESAFGRFSVNERTEMVDQNNLSLMLGSGGVLSRYDYLTEHAGMKKNQHSDTQSSTSMYWWDCDNNTVWASDGQSSVPLSKVKLIQSLINRYSDNDHILNNPALLYDKQSNNVIMRILNEENKQGSIIYNEQSQSFVSIDDIAPKFDVSFDNCLYVTSDDNMYRYNARFGNESIGFNDSSENISLYPLVQYVVNRNSEINKTYDNAEFGGRFYEGTTDRLYAKFSTPLKQSGSITGNDITNREYSFRYTIPRNGSSAYGDRLRGKFMECEFGSTSSNVDFSLQYIINIFRISCS